MAMKQRTNKAQARDSAAAGKVSGAVSGVETKKKRGRPPRISRDEVIQASIRILQHTSVEDFMIKTLAGELGTTSMAIYNYFDSRDELLEAVADEICELFQAPTPRGDWRKKLRAWLWALQEHAEKYPVMPRVIGINGHTSAGWVRATVPVTLILHDELGLRGKELAMSAYIFVSSAITMINMISLSGEYLHAKTHIPLDDLGLDEEQKKLIRKLPIDKLDQSKVFARVFDQLIDGLKPG